MRPLSPFFLWIGASGVVLVLPDLPPPSQEDGGADDGGKGSQGPGGVQEGGLEEGTRNGTFSLCFMFWFTFSCPCFYCVEGWSLRNVVVESIKAMSFRGGCVCVSTPGQRVLNLHHRFPSRGLTGLFLA